MNFSNASFLSRFLAFVLCLFFSLGCFSSDVLANPSLGESLTIAQTAQGTLGSYTNYFVTYKYPTLAFIFRFFRRRPKRNDGSPERTDGAGRRGPCNDLDRSYMALVPRLEPNLQPSLSGLPVGFTAQISPTTYIYLPELPEQALLENGIDDFKAQLMVQQLVDQEEVDFLENTIEISIPVEGGIAAIDFADLGLAFEPAQAYHWYLSIVCDLERPARNPSVDAWTEVIDANEQKLIESQVATISDPLQKVEFYVEQELWHEAAQLLIELRCQDPDNLLYKDELKEMLTSLSAEDEIGINALIADAVEHQQCPIRLNGTTTLLSSI